MGFEFLSTWLFSIYLFHSGGLSKPPAMLACPSSAWDCSLLWDVMKSDVTLFMRADQVEAAWRLLMPVLEVWVAAPPIDFPNYAAGAWGPEETQGLLAHGHSWPVPAELVVHCKKKRKNS
jgi:hypothetical protein